MMMGPTKKKVVTAGIICFLIPVILGSVFFFIYKSNKDKEIAALKVKSETVSRYVLAKDMVAGEVLTADDVKLIQVKGESAPGDSFAGGYDNLINRRLIIDAEAKTIITNSMLFDEADAVPQSDIRVQEFNMITLPSDLQVGDYVDVRITMPTGEDYIVVSGKEVKKLGEGTNTNTFFIELNEEEIIRVSAAIIESYMTTGSEIYATKYVNPSVQLYNSERIDLVKLYNEAYEAIKEEKLLSVNEDEALTSEVSGDDETDNSSSLNNRNNKVEVSTEEIALRLGLDKKLVESVKNAIDDNDKDKLLAYNCWLVKTRVAINNNYPVKSNIARLILDNPNILADLSQRYNIASLEEQRSNIYDIPLYEDNGYGDIEETDSLSKIAENINKKIETQKAERKEYLQALILNEQ